jgi:glycosyltransferase involved in cell wall biosynthesis
MLDRRYAAIDVNTLPDFLVFAPILAKWMGARLILDMHEIAPEFYMSKYGSTENSRAVRLLKYIEKVSMRFADQVLTINEPIEDLLVSRGLSRSKSTVLMNAVDEERFAAHSDMSHSQKHPDKDKFVMMYHGTLTHIYGLDIAIEAFAMAHAEMPGAELWILGSGPESSALDDLVRELGLTSKVKLVGQVASTEIPNWLRQCDAGILPIRRDVFLDFAFPNKLPEFIIMGKPVLVSRLKAIRHYFSENALAYSDPNSPADLGRQMVRLYRDSELRSLLARKASEEYLPIRWELMKQRYLTLMNDLVSTTGRRTAATRAKVTA